MEISGTNNATKYSSNTHSEESNLDSFSDGELPDSTEFVDLNTVDPEYVIEALDESGAGTVPEDDYEHDDSTEKLDTASDNKMKAKRTFTARKRVENHAKKSKPAKVARHSEPTSFSRKEDACDAADNVQSDSEQPTQFRLTIDPQDKTDYSNPVLAKSYPDYFHFEKSPRSVNYTLVFFGERFNSARYGINYTYWQCAHRRKYKCDAMLRTTNDYTAFERRFHHTHKEITVKESVIFTPHEALPHIFKITRSQSAWVRKNFIKSCKMLKPFIIR